MCLTAVLIGGLSIIPIQETKAAERKIIDGSVLTHDEESVKYNTKVARGEDLLTGYSKCVKLGERR